MTNSLNNPLYTTVIKVTRVFLKFSVIALYVLLALLVIGFFSTIFIPIHYFDFDIANIENINIGTTSILFELDNFSFRGIYNIKWLLALLLFTGIVYLVFFQYIQIQLRDIMKNIEVNQPFCAANGHNLRYIGVAFLIASIVLPLFRSWLFMSAINLFEIYQANVNFSIDIMNLFTGVLIIILAYIFDYGAYLQEEHDATV